MNTKAIGWKLGRVVLPALVVAVSLAFTAAASAQTVPFQGSIYQKTEGKANSVTCPIQQYYCGSAYIVGYGTAFWQFDGGTGPTPLGDGCALYPGAPPPPEKGATSTITLDDGSTLTLSETETACQPGASGTTPNFWTAGFGHPLYSTGRWQFVSGTGKFSNLSGGSGTDTLRSDGAILKAAWTGTVTQP